jgi:hypothetical protein
MGRTKEKENLPEFLDSRHMKVATLSVCTPAIFNPPTHEIFLVLTAVRVTAEPRTTVQPKDYVNEKFSWGAIRRKY